MNLCNKVSVGPTGGETFTVTCFTCGMPSSKEWAQRVRSRPLPLHLPQEPFFPFLQDFPSPPPQGAIVLEDGSTFLCAFCHALLECQWTAYEVRARDAPKVPLHLRTYNVTKFICAVCGVETYRKRVRALPFQEFPFLVKQRQPNSITLGNNPLAVVCLDCSETLWAQSAEYDRWGLPVHKRHFNWMARPPPPEDSVEATVARLPSGETQLPRCPPTDPLVPPKTNEPTAQPEAIPPVKSRSKISSGVYSPHRHSSYDLPPTGRKLSASQIPPAASHFVDSPTMPPVVTVAPMSTHNTLTNTRKDSFSSYHLHQPTPSSSSSGGGGKFDGGKFDGGSTSTMGHSSHYTHSSSSAAASGGIFSARGGAYPPWPSSSLGGREEYPHESHHPPPPLGTWPWPSLPPDSPDLLRYHAAYLSSLQPRSMSDAYFPPLYAAPYSPRGSSPPASSSSRFGATPGGPHSPLHQHQRATHASRSPPRATASSGGDPHRSPDSPPAQRRPSLSRPPSSKFPPTEDSAERRGSYPEGLVGVVRRSRSPERRRREGPPPEPRDTSSSSSNDPRDRHPTEAPPPKGGDEQKKILPKKRHWLPPSSSTDSVDHKVSFESSTPSGHGDESTQSTLTLERKRKFAVSSLGVPPEFPVDFSQKRKFSSPHVASPGGEAAMDLSVSSVTSSRVDQDDRRPRTLSCPSGTSSKFSIAFLCKSEATTTCESEGAPPPTHVPPNPPSPKEEAKEEEERQVSDVEEEERQVVDVKEEERQVEEEPGEEEREECGEVKEEVKEEGAGGEEERVVGFVGVGEVVLNAEEFVEQTLAEWKEEAKEVRRRRLRSRVTQIDFLSQLGLITPQKKQKLVLDQIVSRSAKGTVAPLRFRPKSPPHVSLLTRRPSLPSSSSRGSSSKEKDKVEYLVSLGLRPRSTPPPTNTATPPQPPSGGGSCINVPTYVPSYATPPTPPPKEERRSPVEILNVPSRPPPPGGGSSEAILKIPLLPISSRRSSSSSTTNKTSDDSEDAEDLQEEEDLTPTTQVGAPAPPSSTLEETLRASTLQWKKTKAELLEALETPLDLLQLQKIRQELKAQIAEMRETERSVRAKERALLLLQQRRSKEEQ